MRHLQPPELVMPFPQITRRHSLCMNTSADNTSLPNVGSTKGQPLAGHGPLGQVIIRLRRWPNPLKQAVATLLRPSGKQIPTANSSATTSPLQAYMDDYNRLDAEVAALRLDPRNDKVLETFYACRGALETAVACRANRDTLRDTDASPERKRDAETKLATACRDANICIARLRYEVRDRLKEDSALTMGHTLLWAAALGAMIISLAFPPVALAALCVGAAAGGGMITVSVIRLLWLPCDVRARFDDVNKWMRNQPFELVAAEKWLKGRIAEMKANGYTLAN
jgi:hypothetical protein